MTAYIFAVYVSALCSIIHRHADACTYKYYIVCVDIHICRKCLRACVVYVIQEVRDRGSNSQGSKEMYNYTAVVCQGQENTHNKLHVYLITMDYSG